MALIPEKKHTGGLLILFEQERLTLASESKMSRGLRSRDLLRTPR